MTNKKGKIRFLLKIIAGFSLFNPAQALGQNQHHHHGIDLTAGLVLESLLLEATENNPRYRKSLHESLVKKFKIGPAGAYEDPIIEYAAVNFPTDSYRGNQSAMTGREIRLKQKITFPGKLSKKENAAEFEYKSAIQLAKKTKLEVIRDVKTTYFNLYAIHKKLDLTKRNISLLRQLEKSAESKYQVGRGILQDLAKAQVELAENQKKLLLLQYERLLREGDLNILLNRDAHAALGKPQERPISQFDFSDFSMARLSEIAENYDPALKSTEFRVKSSKEKLSYSKWNYLPDFEFGVAYRQREANPTDAGQDFVTATVAINLPIFTASKQNEERKAAFQNLKAAQAENTLVKRHLSHAIHHLYAQAQTDFEMIQLFEKQLIPAAKKALSSAQSAYKVNKVEFLTVINNENTLFHHQMDYYDAIAEYEGALASLEVRLGQSIKEITSRPIKRSFKNAQEQK